MVKVKRLFKSFLISGSVGIAVALLLYLLGNIPYTRAATVRAATLLSPEMYLGLAEPTSLEAIILLLVFVFGTNFVLYGFAGTIVWELWLILTPQKHE